MQSHRGGLFVALVAGLVSGTVQAQVLDWLPVSDLPQTTYERDGHSIPPGLDSICLWDPDGDGPLPKSVVVGGALVLNIPNGGTLAMLTGDGWVGMSPYSGLGALYSMETYTAPGETAPALYAAFGQGAGVYRLSVTGWTHLFDTASVRVMYVADLDGAGPQPKVLLLGGGTDVFSYDGTTITALRGGALHPTATRSLLQWDLDGPGPNPPVLLAACAEGILAWDGATWTRLAAVTRTVYALTSFDFDGAGPDPAELVAAGSQTVIGGATTGQVAVLHNNTWQSVGGVSMPVNSYVVRAVSFDPDAAGPMSPRLVVSGVFSSIAGVPAPNLAYYNDGMWQTFPAHWNAQSVCLDVNDDAAYSDSPQLVVGSLQGARPAFAVFALSSGDPGYRRDPAGGRRLQGDTISLGVQPRGDELSFRWYKGAVQVFSGTTASGSVITGAASPRLTIAGLSAADEGEYHLEIGNAAGIISTQPAPVALGCPSDVNGDTVVDMMDYLDFVAELAAAAPAADFNADLEIDLFDYLDFVQALAGGC